MQFVVKAALASAALGKVLAFDEKTMYCGKQIRVHDRIYIFASENQGGQGLIARGIVTAAIRGPGIRVKITVKSTASARRSLGRRELKPYRELTDQQPQTEIARKLYRQATNKIAGISDAAAKFLNRHF